jgi:hypothetical protein
MAATFHPAIAIDNRPLWSLLCRFNGRLAADVHPRHLGNNLDEGLFERLRLSPRAEAVLSRWIVRRFELDPQGHWDFAEPRLRLALLPAERLARLIRMLGLTMLCRRIAHEVVGRRVRQLRESLGEVEYEFAVKRAPLLARQLPVEFEGSELADDPAGQATELGYRGLACCLVGAPPQVLQRVALKLPPDADISRHPPAIDAAPRLYRLAQRIIAFEIAPELAPCFT